MFPNRFLLKIKIAVDNAIGPDAGDVWFDLLWFMAFDMNKLQKLSILISKEDRQLLQHFSDICLRTYCDVAKMISQFFSQC